MDLVVYLLTLCLFLWTAVDLVFVSLLLTLCLFLWTAVDLVFVSVDCC